MNKPRVWLLLVLAVLLPLRGALAAGMLCPLAGAGAGVVAHAAPGLPVHSHARGAQPQDAHGTHDHAAAPHHHEDGSGHASHDASERCNLCSAFCSVPALPASTLQFGTAGPADTVFTHPAAPPATFIAEGPERPPRSA